MHAAGLSTQRVPAITGSPGRRFPGAPSKHPDDNRQAHPHTHRPRRQSRQLGRIRPGRHPRRRDFNGATYLRNIATGKVTATLTAIPARARTVYQKSQLDDMHRLVAHDRFVRFG
jgi:hypothetical protein